MGDKKNTASQERDSIKISKLGEELGVDPRQIVAAAKEMNMENAKVPASWVTAGQADRLRAKFGGQRTLKEKLERKARYLESGVLDEKKEEAPKTAQPALSRQEYERNRRSIFGVVETPGGVRVESVPTKHSPITAKPAVTGIAKPPAISESAPPTMVTEPLPPAGKFIGIEVLPPVRREPGQPDPRFGVVVPAPDQEKRTAPSSDAVPLPQADLWGKLNDGRPPVEMPVAAAAEDVPATPVVEAKVEIPQPVEPALVKVSEPDAKIEVAPSEQPSPVADVKAESRESGRLEKQSLVDLPPKIHEVPVKMQPKHKAFGAKHKVKHKKHKLLEAAKEHSKKTEHKPAHAATHAHKPHKVEHHATHAVPHKKAEHHAPKSEGLLKRIAKKFLGK